MESRIGHFGGQRFNLLEDYKKPQVSLFEEFKKLMGGRLTDEDLIVPLINWSSNNKANIMKIQDINRNFFYVNKSILNHQLLLSINRNYNFIKYPKKGGKSDLDFLIPYICKYYDWS